MRQGSIRWIGCWALRALVLFNAQILNADEDQVIKLLKDKNATIGLADAGAHLHLFCDADFGLHLWPLDPGTGRLHPAEVWQP